MTLDLDSLLRGEAVLFSSCLRRLIKERVCRAFDDQRAKCAPTSKRQLDQTWWGMANDCLCPEARFVRGCGDNAKSDNNHIESYANGNKLVFACVLLTRTIPGRCSSHS